MKNGSFDLLSVVLVILVVVSGFGWYWCWRSHPVAVCDASHLSLSKGTSSGAAGTIYTHAVVTNNGSQDCTLTGYPGAFLLDGSHMQLGNGATANSLYTPTTVTLAASGGKAHVVLGFPQAGNFNPGVCSANSAYLRLALPGVATPIEASWMDASCPGFSATAIQTGS